MHAIRKAYANGPEGQIHYRYSGNRGADRVVMCLHSAPFSGLAFTSLMPELPQDWRVLAPDYPGHGGSDPFDPKASVADYARAMIAVCEEVSPDCSVDLVGFHTGCLVAAEMALIESRHIGQLVLVDVPAFEPEIRAGHLAASASKLDLSPDMACIHPAWERGITRRVESQGIARSFEMFVEQLRHGEAMNAGFHAGFTYELEERLGALRHPATIIATASALFDVSRRAAQLIPHASLVERPDVTRAVLDEAAPEIALEIRRALDTPASNSRSR